MSNIDIARHIDKLLDDAFHGVELPAEHILFRDPAELEWLNGRPGPDIRRHIFPLIKARSGLAEVWIRVAIKIDAVECHIQGVQILRQHEHTHRQLIEDGKAVLTAGSYEQLIDNVRSEVVRALKCVATTQEFAA